VADLERQVRADASLPAGRSDVFRLDIALPAAVADDAAGAPVGFGVEWTASAPPGRAPSTR
jgi:hypothetical protein